MSDNGTSIARIKRFAGENKTGKNWVYETDKGNFNLPKKTFPQPPPEWKTDSLHLVHWSWFDIPNTQNSMRIVSDFGPVGPDQVDYDPKTNGQKKEPTKTNTQTPTETHREKVDKTAYEVQQDGVIFGNRLNNATNLITALVNSGKVDAGQIATKYDEIFEMFDRAQKTGKFEVPF